MADIVGMYPWRLTFIHEKDGAGENSGCGHDFDSVEESLGVILPILEDIADAVQRELRECAGSTNLPTRQ